MMTIHKYPLLVVDSPEVLLPEGALILDIQTQRAQLCLWALVDTERKVKPRRLVLHGTGHKIHIDTLRLRHISTFQMEGGSLVFHAFEVLA